MFEGELPHGAAAKGRLEFPPDAGVRRPKSGATAAQQVRRPWGTELASLRIGAHRPPWIFAVGGVASVRWAGAMGLKL